MDVHHVDRRDLVSLDRTQKVDKSKLVEGDDWCIHKERGMKYHDESATLMDQ